MIKMPPTPEQEVFLAAAAHEGAVLDALEAMSVPVGAVEAMRHQGLQRITLDRLSSLQKHIMVLEERRQ